MTTKVALSPPSLDALIPGSERGFRGMGIGLYISSQSVQRHGGRLWAKSTKGIGSTCFLSLPLMHARRRSKRQEV
jgi:signal transduction histidine kinase